MINKACKVARCASLWYKTRCNKNPKIALQIPRGRSDLRLTPLSAVVFVTKFLFNPLVTVLLTNNR